MAFAFIVVIASFFHNRPNRFAAWVNAIDRLLYFGLSVAGLGSVAIAGVKPPQLLYVVAAFFVLTLGTFLFHLFRTTTQLALNLGNRGAAIRVLRVLAFIFGFFAFMMVIMQRNLFGGPVLYSALAVVLLSIASLL